MGTFKISNDTMVMTTTYVTQTRLPILYVTHEDDEEGGSFWQFHCGNGDYAQDKLQLVRLDTLLKTDATLLDVSDLPMGSCARRTAASSPWVIAVK